jgi:3-hydroxy acid dehydrogenase / malonic semialdehyde reductase
LKIKKEKKMILKNKLTFITGASSGIGKACAEEFAKAGSNLILTARRYHRISDLAETLTKTYGVKVKAIQMDVMNITEVQYVVASLQEGWRDIDILINNAGLSRGLDKIYEGEIKHWEEMIDTNVKGLLYVTREILPGMVARQSGHIINLGSTAGREVYPNGNVYCATKYAVGALTKAIKLDTLDKNIKVTSVDPGMVETEFSEVRFNGDKEKAKKVYENITPLTAQDVAETILFCATRPPHVNIGEVLITPTAQASASQIFKNVTK